MSVMSIGAAQAQPSLLAEAARIASEFDLSSDDVRSVTAHFVTQMRMGLKTNQPWQLPSYVTKIPVGDEKGRFLAIDLGGTNCRICLVDMNGDSTFTLVQSKHPVPASVRVHASYRPLFRFVAKNLSDFLGAQSQNDGDSDNKGAEDDEGLNGCYRLGFTFSFTCEQTSLGHGTLIHWDKGWDIPEALGRDPCAMLQEAIDELRLPVLVSVLANDSVGTLMTRSYTSRSKGTTLAGVIIGTGTNAAYVEKLENIPRLEAQGHQGEPNGVMVINTEWGCFDDDMQVLPTTLYDDTMDAASEAPGSQMLEKRMSGLYLGELFRLVVLHLMETARFTMAVDDGSPVFRRGGVDSSLLSYLAEEDGDRLGRTKQHVTGILKASKVTTEDCRAIRLVASAIARRAARLAGASLAAIIIQSGRLEPASTSSKPGSQINVQSRYRSWINRLSIFYNSLVRFVRRQLKSIGIVRVMPSPQVDCPPQSLESGESLLGEDIIDIGVDGSLIELYPGFEAEMRGAMREIQEIGVEGERRIQIGFAKDASGVGAALMAQAALAQAAGREEKK